MKIAVFGLRGMPGVQGGIETHAQCLYPRLVAKGCEVTVLARTCFQPTDIKSYQGVRIVNLPTVRTSGIEALVHSIVAAVYCAFSRPNIVHVHAVGPGLTVPMLRAFGLRVVFTHHGPDYERQKWGPVGRMVLRIGERFASTMANGIIAISAGIRDLLWDKYRVRAKIIRNGVNVPELTRDSSALSQFGIDREKYVLCVGRFVPEKRQNDLIDAFVKMKARTREFAEWKLVLVGATDRFSVYSDQLITAASKRSDVVLTGFRSGAELDQLYRWAGVFCLPSSHEGLPIALLEALSYGLPVVASNIKPNLEVELTPESYFPLGDTAALAESLAAATSQDDRVALRDRHRLKVTKKYDWESAANSTCALYQEVLASGKI